MPKNKGYKGKDKIPLKRGGRSIRQMSVEEMQARSKTGRTFMKKKKEKRK